MWATPRTWVTSELITAAKMNSHIRDQFLHIGRGARVFNSVAQNVNNSAITVIGFDSEVFDTGGFHDTSTNSGRMTIPAGMGGGYLIGWSAQWDSWVPGWIGLRDNSGTIVALSGNWDVGFVSIASLNGMPSGAWIEAIATQTSGVTKQILAQSANSPYFWIVPLGGSLNQS